MTPPPTVRRPPSEAFIEGRGTIPRPTSEAFMEGRGTIPRPTSEAFMEGRGTMQSVILALQHFWGERGCLIWQPYYTQVGAGTMNPATFLRVLGPEPWRVAYV